MVRIKICGMTRPEDALLAADLGVDAIGLVFADSPRRVDVPTAMRIVDRLPPFVSRVGVFVNSTADEMLRIAREVGLTEIQLHGDEPAATVEALRPYRVIKALRVRDAISEPAVKAYLSAGVGAILLDRWDPSRRGGTGEAFDWKAVSGVIHEDGRLAGARWILAGGLTPENVATAIDIVRPWGVDVSSGVERSVGNKRAERMASFVNNARRALAPGKADDAGGSAAPPSNRQS